VRLSEYSPDDFDALCEAAAQLRVPSLRHRPFVDYYYSDNPWSKLYFLTGGDGSIAGVMGVDQMRFAAGERFLTLGFASNFHAAQPGAGGYLYLHWMKTSPCGLVFGGSEHTHKILRQQRWTYIPGLKFLTLNRPFFIAPEEPMWRRLAKRLLTNLRQTPMNHLTRRIPAGIAGRLSVHEEQTFSEDMLPRTSPFDFRFAPTLDYLNWRYRTGLSFVRYRIFRLCVEGRTAGYVVLNETPNRVLVAQCDGESPADLSHGVLLCLVAATEKDRKIREIVLTSSHPDMQRIYQSFGFRVSGPDRPFVVGSRRGSVDLPADPSSWLVNYDWGDNGLRAPFLDQNPDGATNNANREQREKPLLEAARSGDRHD
jgi:hypothetical protein